MPAILRAERTGIVLIGDEALERSAVVANCQMNRERRLPSYNRELGIDIPDVLRSRLRSEAPVRWLDLCCGTANALGQAADLLGEHVEIVGVDLVDFFSRPSQPPTLRLVTASVTTWHPENAFDLITCVHGLHYVGDKLGVIAKIAGWLADDGLFVANFDVRGIRLKGGEPVGRRLAADLRSQGLSYNGRTKRVCCAGRRVIDLPYRYLGSDDQAPTTPASPPSTPTMPCGPSRVLAVFTACSVG